MSTVAASANVDHRNIGNAGFVTSANNNIIHFVV